MAAVITSMSPPRGRAADTLTITGTGFGLSGNTVTIGGVAASVVTENTTVVTVTVPGGIPVDDWAVVVLTSGEDASVATRQWWGKATIASLQSFSMAFQPPGDLEDWGAVASEEHDREFEARDIETMHELLQLIPLDLLPSVGNLVGRGAAVLGTVNPGATHDLVTLDHSDSGIKIRARRLATLTWGRQLQLGETTEQLLSANGTRLLASSIGEEQATPDGGRLIVLWVAVGKIVGGDKLDRVRLFRDGVAGYDSGPGLALVADSVHVAPLWGTFGDVTAVEMLSVGCTKDAGGGTVDLTAYLQVF